LAHHQDAIKRIKQSEKRRVRNKTIRTFYRNRIRDVRAAVDARDLAAAQGALAKAVSSIDKAVTENVLHRNTASRYISRLTRSVNGLKSGQPAAQA